MKHNTSRIWHNTIFIFLFSSLALKSSPQEPAPLTPVQPMGNGNRTSASHGYLRDQRRDHRPPQLASNKPNRYSPNVHQLPPQTTIDALSHILSQPRERNDETLNSPDLEVLYAQALHRLSETFKQAAIGHALLARALYNQTHRTSRRKRKHSQDSVHDLSRLSPLEKPNGSTSLEHTPLSSTALRNLDNQNQSVHRIRRTSTQRRFHQQPRQPSPYHDQRPY